MSSTGLFLCSDGNKYVFKPPTLQRALVAEHVVGRLGSLLGAPCMEVCYGDVPEDLIAIQPGLAAYKGGKAHATRFIDGLVERRGVPAHFDVPQNRGRFASLLVLYTWLQAADHQLMYELALPNLVYSHDHGLFFPGAHQWSAATIAGSTVTVRDSFFNPIGLQQNEIDPAIAALEGVTDGGIEEIVKSALPEWGVSTAELDALHVCLSKRRLDCLIRLKM